MDHFDWLRGFAFPYANFILFAVVLVKLGKKPVKEAFESRKKSYEQLYARAKHEKEQAEKKLLDLNKKMSGLDDELEVLKKSAEEAAQRNALKVHQNAEQIATRLIEDAKLMASHETQMAQRELLSEVLTTVRTKVASNLKQASDPDQLNSSLTSQMSSLSKSADRLKGA